MPKLAPQALLIADPARSLRTLIVKLGLPKDAATKVRAANFSDFGGHSTFRPFSTLDLPAGPVTVFDMGEAVEAHPAHGNKTQLGAFMFACRTASTVVILASELDEHRLKVAHLARVLGVSRVALVTNEKAGAWDVGEARQKLETIGYAADAIALVEGDLKASARCRCAKAGCVKCEPWRCLSELMSVPARTDAGFALCATQSIGHGLSGRTFVVETSHAPPEVTVGTKVNIVLPGREVAAPVMETTERGYVFASSDVEVKKVAGIASLGRKVMAVRELELEPLVGPPPPKAVTLGSYVFEGNLWSVTASVDGDRILVCPEGKSAAFASRWIDKGAKEYSVPVLCETGGIAVLQYLESYQPVWMVGRVRDAAKVPDR